MKCPVCKEIDLVMTERSGIEIDYCPKCRGVWLDRGELDKIIERSSDNTSQPQNRQYEEPRRDNYERPRYEEKPYDARKYDDRRYYDDDDYYKHGHYSKHKKRSFLSDIFDFD